MLCFVVLCCVMLCCVVMCYVVLVCVVLWCGVFGERLSEWRLLCVLFLILLIVY